MALAGALLLSGCALFEPPPEPGPPPAAAEPVPPPTAASVPPPLPIRKPPAPVAALNYVPLPAATERIDPEHIIGMSQNEAAAWLGEPAQRAEAAPATIWRYAAPNCEVDLYFYLDLQSKVTRVLHYEVRSNDGAERRRERCFEQLVAERRGRSGSGSSTDRSR